MGDRKGWVEEQVGINRGTSRGREGIGGIGRDRYRGTGRDRLYA